MADTPPLPSELEALLRTTFVPREQGVLIKRFNHAFRVTQDLDSAMSSVNELMEKPLTYQEFFAIIRR